jgi:archaellum biogenesis ATPase FlaH/DNA-binding transcriptional ArsR family regulator
LFTFHVILEANPSNTTQKGFIMDFNDINKSFSRINKGLNEIDKGIKQHKKENKQQMNNDILRMLKLMSEDMQRYNANEKSIQLALKGTYEFFKIAAKVNIPQSSINRLAHTDNIAQQNISSYGTPLSEVATQQLTWLWEKRIPQGKITLLEGDPGMSKSLLAIDIAAHISTGRPLPGDNAGKKGSVILIAPEDGAADTIKPRMEAAAGDLSQVLLLNTVESLDVKDVKNVNFYQRPFSLSHNLFELEQTIKQTKAILVIVDPLTAVLGRTIDSSRDQDVREIFTPLALLAERTNCAILIIRHLKKGTSDNLLYRGAGSIAIIAAARTSLTIIYDPADEKKRVLAVTKSNLCEPPNHLSYQVVQNENGFPYIEWLGENNLDISTLIGPGINLSFPRQEIIKVLEDASTSLDLKTIAERTGQNYKTLRMTLSRMYEAGLIARPFRGKYTTLEQDAESKKRIKAREEWKKSL